ncbi:MAG TPA: NADPH:quinone oxidoreductase family protein [Nocardioidaceae bacterium]|nr:NADPH:quinone oxidoreductase family protein [Nocardioidaceae bacterium]
MAARTSSRSWQVHRLGPPAEALRLEERDHRPPGPGEVRVAVSAVGLNFPDLLVCAGGYQERPALPFSPGFEAAGTVAESGPDSGIGAGTSVLVVPELPEGAMQESLTVPASQVYPVPDEMPATTAAVLHVAYATAHAALHRRGALRTGETVLVSGGSGGVGSAAIQLAKAAGAYVVALATGRRKTDACRAFGADLAIDLGEEDTDRLPARVREATGGRGADVIVDVVGGALFQQLRRCVAFEGRLVSVGFTGGELPSAPVNHVLLRNYAVTGLHLAAYRRENPAALRGIHDDLVELWRSGAIVPAIHAELPFEQAPAGLELLAAREVVGRVVLRCAPGTAG